MIRNSVSPKKLDKSYLYTLSLCLKTTYALTQDRNFENFLQKIGVAKEPRRRAINLKSTIKLTRKNGRYTLTTVYTDGKVNKINFELDKPIVRKLENGGDATCMFTINGRKLQEVITTNSRTITVAWVFAPSAVTVTMLSDNDRCERFYKKVSKPGYEDIKSETSRRSVSTSDSSDTTGETFTADSEIEIRNIV